MVRRFFAKDSKRWMMSIALMIGLALLVAVATLMLYRSSSDENQSDTQTVNEELPEEPLSPEEAFVAQKFYNRIENGMDLAQLSRLAGKSESCISTGVYPPPKTTSCYWSDRYHIVYIELGEEGVVVSKAIQENEPGVLD